MKRQTTLFSHVKHIAIGYVNNSSILFCLIGSFQVSGKSLFNFYGQVLPGHHCVWIVNDHVAETMLV